MKRTALVFSHEPGVAELLGNCLATADYDVTTTTTGTEVVRTATQVRPQLIIADPDIPGLDVLNFARTIRENEGLGSVYIILTIGQASEAMLAEALDNGVDDFLGKPVRPGELLARLHNGERLIDLETKLAEKRLETARLKSELEIARRLAKEASGKLHLTAVTDSLTGLPNRGAGMDTLQRQWAGSDRSGNPLSCVVADIDNFKRINDTHGNAVGDMVLLKVARVIRKTARTHEMLSRIGGAEFLVACENSSAEMAAIAAERLRQAVEAMVLNFQGLQLQVTISLGVAERTEEMGSPEDLLNLADAAMRRAKEMGRNRICVAGAKGEDHRPTCDCTTRSVKSKP